MTDHELQAWLNNLSTSTEPMCQLINLTIEAQNNGDSILPLDDTFGWGARFSLMWKKKTLDKPSGLLLTGPGGCGRHTAAAHMARTLYDTHCPLLLSGKELCAEGYAPATRRLRYVLDHPNVIDGQSYPWCLILDGLEDCDCRRDLLSWLGQVMELTWYESGGEPSLFVILIDSCEKDVPSNLRRHLRLCRMSAPAASHRRAYFESPRFPMICNAVNLELLVSSTEGFTYAQLVDLAQNLECALYCLPSDQSAFSDSELREFLQGQTPDVSQEDPLRSLALSARLFIEHLPELMTHMGTGGNGGWQRDRDDHKEKDDAKDPIDTPQPNPGITKEQMQQELMEKPVREVTDDLFGKERIARMEAQHKARIAARQTA